MSAVEKISNQGSGKSRHNPPTEPLPSLEEIQAALAGAQEKRRPAWHYAAAGVGAVVLVGGVFIATKGSDESAPSAPIAIGEAPFKSKPAGPEVRPNVSDVCGAFLDAPRSLLKDKTIPKDYTCSEGPQTEKGTPASKPLLPLPTMSGKPEAFATWAHPRAPLRRIEMQVTEDRSSKGNSLFDTIALEYGDSGSTVQAINGYPARFIPDIGKSTVKTTAEKDVSATIVNVPTTEGLRNISIAIQWGGGFGAHNSSITRANQMMESSALASAIPVLLPGALPPK